MTNRTRIGRPPLPRGQAKGELLSVRFSTEEKRALERAAARNDESVSDWARRTLLSASAGASSRSSAHGENSALLMREVERLSREQRLTTTAIAGQLGISQPHASDLLCLARDFPRDVLDAWERDWETPHHVPLAAMKRLRVSTKEHEALRREYRLLVEKAEMDDRHARESHRRRRRPRS